MSTEFNPMDGLLADLLSTWDEEPAVEEAAAEPPAARAPLPFVSALVRPPAVREPLFPVPVFPEPVHEIVMEAEAVEVSPLEVVAPVVLAPRSEPELIEPEPIKPEPLLEVAAASVELPVLAALEMASASEVLTPTWEPDPAAAAACAAILARMERELADSEPAPIPIRRTRLGQDVPRYVVFAVREMLFAVPIARVLETDRMTPVTPLPGAAPGVKGLTNLRGEVVPVIDLRDVLGWAPADNPAGRRMLVIQDGNRQPLTALLVDQVKGLAGIANLAWKSAEMAGAHGAEGFVEAVAERDQEWVSRLNLDRVLNETHLPSLAAA
ncbi:MAG: chemotaxis protein CheW [Bryobacteraceae bacterium]|nr:chemotaxis protein CheW [Bryobacteraceae bacterium]